MPDGDEKLGLGSCPHCHTSMRYLEKRHDMPPFWRLRSHFFRLPFATEPLLLILIASLCAMTFHVHAVLGALVGSLLSLLIVNYAQALARSIRKDGLSKERITPGINSAFDFRRFKDNFTITCLLSVCFITPLLLFHYINGFSATLFVLLTLSLLPALLLMLLYDDQGHTLHAAPQPSYLQIIKKMHLSYAGLVAYLYSGYLLTITLADLARELLPSYSQAVVASLLTSYFTLTLFGLLGYVLKRYESFTIKTTAPLKPPKTHSTAGGNSLRLDADLDMAIKDGDYLKAIALLEESVKKNAHSDLRVQQLYKLLLEHKDMVRLERYNHLFIELLLARGQNLAAYELVEMLRKAKPEFVIYNLSVCLNLAEVFYEMKEYALVIWLAQDAHSRTEPCTDLAKLYLLAAKTLLAKSKSPKKAAFYLEFIVEHFPNSDSSEASQRLLQHLESRPTSK